jgi:transglutaminase-like putative cysteine protease
MDAYLDATRYVDSDHQDVIQTAAEIMTNAGSPKDAALRIFHYVRDEILFALGEHSSASETLRRKTGQCVTKSGLQIALLRAVGIPARFHCVDVHRNCLKGLIASSVFGQFDEIIPDHPWCECFLTETWVACESIFDKALYESAIAQRIIDQEDIGTIDWDGEHDLVVLSRFIVKDKGTHPDLDTLLDRYSQEFAAFWPIIRAASQHTIQVREIGNSRVVSDRSEK